jgi:leukotriene-A4 hydrolase
MGAKKLIALAITAGLFFLGACNNSAKKDSIAINNHSYSNFDKVRMKHLHWICNVDFQNQTLKATARWRFENFGKASQMVLDVYDQQISKVRVAGKEVPFKVGEIDKTFGAPLTFAIGANDTIVEIEYTTSKTATALQWLQPQQTAGKKQPYLFTQCESINTRTIIPCMDAPNQRITYTADLQVLAGMMALMSAENPQQRSGDGRYHFDMPIAIPTYLIALAVGDISFKAIDARSGVYAEPSMLDKAASEFSDIPKMIAAAEQLAGPYKWGRYDVLVQPPSFPIGGMENPKLTFVTPTVLAGDKSLVSLVAHELAHSWSGNTVTNSNWSDLWLNEGFTTYFERRIMERLQGKDYADMLWELSYQDMMADLADLGDTSADTRLQLSVDGRDPEEAFTNIPYEKGAHFLWQIERTVGRERFDKTMVAYFNKYAFVPMDTKTCLNFLDSMLKPSKPNWKTDVNVDAWVYSAGVPANCPRPNFVRFAIADSAAAAFNRSGALPDKKILAKWSAHEYLAFLRKLAKPQSVEKLTALDAHIGLTNTSNSEIAFEWFLQSLESNYTPVNAKLEAFLLSVGRKKFVKPLYTKMLEVGKKNKQVADKAREIFAQAKSGYHPETVMAVEKVMEQK